MFKIVKQTNFSFEKDGATINATAYRVAYKGRVYSVSSLRFEDGEITVKDGMLSFSIAVELKEEIATDKATGETTKLVAIYPKNDLQMAADYSASSRA